MNIVAIVLFVLALLYLVAFFVEIPIFYEGNPKTRFMIEKMGKRNYKIMLLVFAISFLIFAFVIR